MTMIIIYLLVDMTILVIVASETIVKAEDRG